MSYKALRQGLVWSLVLWSVEWKGLVEAP